MAALGRKRPLKTVDFEHSERPLSGKADIQPETSEIGLPNDRYAPQTSRSDARIRGIVNGCL